MQGVRGLTVVGVAEPAARGKDSLGELVLVQSPAGQVHLVNALVAQVAVAVVPEPVPVVVEPVGIERPLGRGAEPDVVVNAGGHGAIGLVADGAAGLVAEALGHVDLAELARVDEGHGVLDTLVAA